MTTIPQRESTIAVPDDRRKQLGAFLRARRESLDPQRLGLPRVGRRRTPGLRREEVAMPPRRTAAMHWRRAFPLLPSIFRVLRTVSVRLPFASKPTASITASTPRWPGVLSIIHCAGSSWWSKFIGIAP